MGAQVHATFAGTAPGALAAPCALMPRARKWGAGPGRAEWGWVGCGRSLSASDSSESISRSGNLRFHLCRMHLVLSNLPLHRHRSPQFPGLAPLILFDPLSCLTLPLVPWKPALQHAL